MEMGLSQADAARCLNVFRSMVQRPWDQYQSEDSASRRHVSGPPRVTTPAEDRFLALSARRRRSITVPQLVADHFVASGRRTSATTVRRRLPSLCKATSCVCPPQRTTEKGPLMLGKRTRFMDQTTMGFCTLHRRVQIHTGERFRASADQRTRYHQSNTLERHSYRGGGIMVWAGISLGGHTDLHVFHGGTLTGVRYRDEILDPYVRPYADAIGNDFILMDDNARPYRFVVVEDYIKGHGFE
ncbi:hypothetical protein AVEN_235482-1 [Araneus ventricosus]|uniref:Tc1-like transposase DDE domain-containing protein n=1 Tax=Araneus ventricosus TaxID=182803 RepID=A0A4Y2A455_ARAVE|nr:hypothetical protein AVEN_235482-1 [Araneus ventricosus]